MKLYYFDKSLRGIIFSAIQSVEIALRTSIIQNFSMKYGPFWFMDVSLFKNAQIYNECINSIQAELSRTKEDFIQEHFDKYDSPNHVSTGHAKRGILELSGIPRFLYFCRYIFY